ncbi:MAG: cell division protein FtsZ [Chthoniobacterales bacterium]|nr:cell division protein FtsZ [Chthoniobacterales bacterium]
MIQLSRNYSLPEKQEDDLAIKIIGVGGAGCNALDRIILDGLERVDLIAANTDVQSLASSVATQKVQLGRTVTRGLGAGGDPELGFNAADESADEIRETLQGARMVFVCAGLGGGTGSGAAPCIVQMARESGALVVAFATLPFAFEGKRRGAQASEGLRQLQQLADAVVCFENDRMGDMVLPKAGVHQAFAAADLTISQSVRAIVQVVRRPGLIRIGFDELLAALRSRNSRCLFGYGESDSDNRAHEALALALKNPLMDRGKMLTDARHLLVQISGGPGMTLTEVEMVMQELNRHVEDQTQILFGTSVDGKMGNRMSVTLISSVGSPEEAQPFVPERTRLPEVTPFPTRVLQNPAPISSAPEETAPIAEAERELRAEAEAPSAPARIEAEITSAPLIDPEPIAAVAPPPPPPREKKVALPKPAAMPNEMEQGKNAGPRKEKAQARQEVMQFESVNRGRFEKSEPTIVEGQDLDVPTFLRKNVRVK